jgi:hypothetical protein
VRWRGGKNGGSNSTQNGKELMMEGSWTRRAGMNEKGEKNKKKKMGKRERRLGMSLFLSSVYQYLLLPSVDINSLLRFKDKIDSSPSEQN